jgi:hypothetical protein
LTSSRCSVTCADRTLITLTAPNDDSGNLRRLYLVLSGEDGSVLDVLDGSKCLVVLDRTGFDGRHLLGPHHDVSVEEYEQWAARLRG